MAEQLTVQQKADAYEAVKSALADNDQLLGIAIQAAANPIVQQLAENQTLLDHVSERAQSAISARLGSNTRLLNQVLTQVQNAAGQGQTPGQQSLQQVLVAVGPSGNLLHPAVPSAPGQSPIQPQSAPLGPIPPVSLPGGSAGGPGGVPTQSPAPPGTEYWVCVLKPLTGECVVISLGGDPGPPLKLLTDPPNNYQVKFGPSSDFKATWDFCQHCQSGGTPAPPPTQPPPTQPSQTCPTCGCCPCQCCPAPATAPPPPPPKPPAPPGEPGPSPQPSEPPPPPALLKGPPAMLGECLPDVSGNLPPVGSQAWCVCLDALVKWCHDATGWLLSFLNGESDTSNWNQYLPTMPVLDLPLIGPAVDLGKILGTVLANGGTALQSAWSQIITPLQNSQIQYADLLAIDLMRAITRFLAGVRIGWDIAIWGTLDLEITLPWLERILHLLENYVYQTEAPSVGDAIECYLQQTAPDGQVKCWMAMQGANLDAWKPVIDARREKLFTQELLEWGRRHDYTDDQLVQLLQLRGWYRVDEATARVELYDHLPTISDHLHWLQRNVFDDAYVQDYRLMDGFEERFWTKFGHDLRALGMRKDYAALHYAAHWINPAPGQLQEMVYRLRPDKDGVQNPFTSTDYQRILAEQDVAPYFRPRFGEIIYRVPALGYLRDMYRSFLLSDEEMRSYHLDLGYSPSDSDNFVRVDKLVRSRIRASEAHNWTPAALAHAYVASYATPEQVYAEMALQGFTTEEADKLMRRAEADLAYTTFTRARGRVLFALLTQIRQALAAGVVDGPTASQQLQGIGWDQSFADGWVQIEATVASVGLVKQATTRIRQSYLRGDIDRLAADQSLQTLGVVPGKITELLAIWDIENNPHKREATKSEIIAHLASGDLSTADAVNRLGNLGYSQPDIVLYLADASRRIRKREDQAAALAEKRTKAAAAQLARLQRQAQQQADKLLAQLKRAEPVAKLQKWASLGLISQAYFFRRMGLYGFSQAEADAYWNEAAAKKGSTIAPVSPPGPG